MSKAERPKIGFIGAGRMATALANGLVNSDFTSADYIIAFDVSSSAATAFCDSAPGMQSVESSAALLEQAEVIILAVKPHFLAEVMSEIQPHLRPEHLVVSIAAGVSLTTMQLAMGADARIVRVMPNTPALVGAGAAGYALGEFATEDDSLFVEKLLSTVGIAFEVPEPLIDSVTGLSGSGPAYVYQIIEAFSDGGVKMGLPRDVATNLAAQTLLGAARMVLETDEHPGALKDAVTSPGGTTIAGLQVLERGALRGTLIDAIEAATLRARELGAEN